MKIISRTQHSKWLGGFHRKHHFRHPYCDQAIYLVRVSTIKKVSDKYLAPQHIFATCQGGPVGLHDYSIVYYNLK